MNDNPLRTCPKCNVQYPAVHFRLRNDPVKYCRACRRRDATRKNMRKKRALYKMLGLPDTRAKTLQSAIDYAAAASKAKSKQSVQKLLKMRFNAVTGHIRSRIKTMEYNPNPPQRTLHALKVRRAQLAKYEAAYSAQLALLDRDVLPVDIEQYIDQ